ncbi:MAG: prepilin-type N-terminal cleavage/methylation domain-containing protein [Verrucomicrobiota bacterium]
MDFNPTFTNRIRPRRTAAFTLVEMMMALAIGGIVLAVVGTLSIWSGRSFAAMANYTDLDNASRNALDRLTREIRQVQGLNSYSDDSVQKELSLIDSDGQPLYFRYNKSGRTLTRVKSGISQTLLRDCNLLNFNLYQRNNVSNTFNQFQVANGTNASLTCKVIQVNWVCSRKLFPTELLNSESIQTAKIVIRHH